MELISCKQNEDQAEFEEKEDKIKIKMMIPQSPGSVYGGSRNLLMKQSQSLNMTNPNYQLYNSSVENESIQNTN
jgi:hypothetical protein